jgi:hypothetical protein
MRADLPTFDFAMSYPCFVLLDAAGKVEAWQVDERRCLCLFTDEEAVESFFRAKHADSPARTAKTLRCRAAAGLLKLLRQWGPGLEAQGVREVALDPLPGRRTMTAVVADVVRALEWLVELRGLNVGDVVRVEGGPFDGARGPVRQIEQRPARAKVEAVVEGRVVHLFVEPEHVRPEGHGESL